MPLQMSGLPATLESWVPESSYGAEKSLHSAMNMFAPHYSSIFLCYSRILEIESVFYDENKNIFPALEDLFLSGNMKYVQKKKESKSPAVKLDGPPYSYTFRNKRLVNY